MKPFVVSLSNHTAPFDRLRACPVLDTGANGIVITLTSTTKYYCMVNLRTAAVCASTE